MNYMDFWDIRILYRFAFVCCHLFSLYKIIRNKSTKATSLNIFSKIYGPNTKKRLQSKFSIYLCIHVCSIHVYLTTVVMNNFANLINTLLINSMGWRIGNLKFRSKQNKRILIIPCKLDHIIKIINFIFTTTYHKSG